MNRKFLFLIVSLGILLIFIINLNIKTEVSGIISEIKYHNAGLTIKIDNNEFFIFEDKILDISKGDFVEMKIKEQTYKGEKQLLIEKITKYTKS
jgi:hypothetical protein